MKNYGFLILLCTCLFSFCKKEDSSDIPQFQGNLATIQYDEMVTFSSHDLDIHFNKILDSRCPCDAACIWEGIAEVTLQVSSPQGDSSIIIYSELNTPPANDSIFLNQVSVFGKTIRLVEVRPESCNNPPPEDYEIDVEVQ